MKRSSSLYLLNVIAINQLHKSLRVIIERMRQNCHQEDNDPVENASVSCEAAVRAQQGVVEAMAAG